MLLAAATMVSTVHGSDFFDPRDVVPGEGKPLIMGTQVIQSFKPLLSSGREQFFRNLPL